MIAIGAGTPLSQSLSFGWAGTVILTHGCTTTQTTIQWATFAGHSERIAGVGSTWQARSHGGAALAERLEGRQRVLQLQERTAEALQDIAQQSHPSDGDAAATNGGAAAGRGAEVADAAAALQESPQDLAALYNDYAAHFQVRQLLQCHLLFPKNSNVVQKCRG